MADTKKKIRLKDLVTGEYLYPEVDISLPTKLSELNNDTGFITASAIKDASLTIQKNGSALGTFTANQGTDKTINIIVPTNASDIGALASTTKMVSSLELSMDETTYVITATLKDQDGTAVGTPATIDLPLESVVVSGSYDNTNKKIILTLKSGDTVDIPVADLVAGLQTSITSTNKLSADLVADGTTHKMVTAAEKATWNGKQAAISDLATIRSNASAGKTASDTIATYGDIVTSAKADFAPATHSHKKADITDFPTIPAAITETTVSGWGFTKNEGTVTSVKINDTEKTPTHGVVDLGAVATVTDTFSETETKAMSGKAVASALSTMITTVCAALDAKTTEWSAT